jgi:hypothetical protein
MLALTKNSAAQNFAYGLEERSRIVGLKPLHEGRGLPNGRRELRIWFGFGMIEPETLTRIRTDGKSVHGSKIFWWTRTTENEEIVAELDPQAISTGELYANLQATAGCGPVRRYGDHEMCTARLAAGQSWQSILQSLDSLGVGDLASGDAVGIDGWRMVVEARDGPSYRTYSYFMPDTSASDPQTRRAAFILQLVCLIGYRE